MSIKKITPKELGDNIKTLRNKLGMTQISFSKKIKVSQAYLSMLENGEYFPSLETLFKIEEKFGVNIMQLKLSKKEFNLVLNN